MKNSKKNLNKNRVKQFNSLMAKSDKLYKQADKIGKQITINQILDAFKKQKCKSLIEDFTFEGDCRLVIDEKPKVIYQYFKLPSNFGRLSVETGDASILIRGKVNDLINLINKYNLKVSFKVERQIKKFIQILIKLSKLNKIK